MNARGKTVIVRLKKIRFFGEFIEFLRKYCSVASKSDWASDSRHKASRIYIGLVNVLEKPILQSKPGVGHSDFDTLVCRLKAYTEEGVEVDTYRIVFIGSCVLKLSSANISKGDFIAILNPSKLKTNRLLPPSYSVGPCNIAIWICSLESQLNNVPQLPFKGARNMDRNLVDARKRNGLSMGSQASWQLPGTYERQIEGRRQPAIEPSCTPQHHTRAANQRCCRNACHSCTSTPRTPTPIHSSCCPRNSLHDSCTPCTSTMGCCQDCGHCGNNGHNSVHAHNNRSCHHNYHHHHCCHCQHHHHPHDNHHHTHHDHHPHRNHHQSCQSCEDCAQSDSRFSCSVGPNLTGYNYVERADILNEHDEQPPGTPAARAFVGEQSRIVRRDWYPQGELNHNDSSITSLLERINERFNNFPDDRLYSSMPNNDVSFMAGQSVLIDSDTSLKGESIPRTGKETVKRPQYIAASASAASKGEKAKKVRKLFSCSSRSDIFVDTEPQNVTATSPSTTDCRVLHRDHSLSTGSVCGVAGNKMKRRSENKSGEEAAPKKLTDKESVQELQMDTEAGWDKSVLDSTNGAKDDCAVDSANSVIAENLRNNCLPVLNTSQGGIRPLTPAENANRDSAMTEIANSDKSGLRSTLDEDFLAIDAVSLEMKGKKNFILEVSLVGVKPSFIEEKPFDLVCGHCPKCQRVIPFSRLIRPDISSFQCFCSVCNEPGDTMESKLMYFFSLIAEGDSGESVEIITTGEEAQHIIGIPVDDYLGSKTVASQHWNKLAILIGHSDSPLKCMLSLSLVSTGSNVAMLLSSKIALPCRLGTN